LQALQSELSRSRKKFAHGLWLAGRCMRLKAEFSLVLRSKF
jgi:hypothetical protein